LCGLDQPKALATFDASPVAQANGPATEDIKGIPLRAADAVLMLANPEERGPMP